ncbi:hypothetical protein [Shewanella xiamenensis]|uniref:hypothetical protein n=1 Tax=Shewanella xiamenensis TaxID=332186 RepID=UPI0021BE372D|nr:hypothetical protein [Shewanella xiamenensis]MCT8876643.1 hypothetical protein [Shewanella xiamenensis]
MKQVTLNMVVGLVLLVLGCQWSILTKLNTIESNQVVIANNLMIKLDLIRQAQSQTEKKGN